MEHGMNQKSIRILFVEDLPTDVELAERELKKAGMEFRSFRVETEVDFIRALLEYQPELIISDYSLPQFDGMRALKLTRDYNRFLPFVVLTGSMNEDTAVTCMKAGANDYVIKEHITRLPFAVTESLEQASLQTDKKKTEELFINKARELAVTQEATINSMAILAEFRDPETGAHIQRTKFYVKLLLEKLGSRMPYAPDRIELIWHSAPLHDIGKVGIPDSILFKPGKLTREEVEIMKKHTLIGSDVIQRAEKILGEISFLNFAREITEYHHEKWDGTGYPHGLKGEAIPLCARVMALADVYDALVKKRVYKDPIPHAEAVKIIRSDAETHFDPFLVEIFEESHLEFDRIAREYQD